MAVHPCLNGLTIRTKVNGRFSHEYDDDEQTLDEGSLSKYIEAKSGAHFAIGLDFSDEYLYKTIPMVAQVLIDGESMGHYLFGPFDLHRPLKYYEEIDGINVDKPEGSMRHRFAFSEIVIDEDADASPVKFSEITDLGQIVIKLWRSKSMKRSELRSKQCKLKKDVGALSEKTLKGRALSHTMRLKDPIPVAGRMEVYHSVPLDPVEKPFATYKFKYRSLDALKALCIVPRSPTLDPLEDKPVESLSPDEMRDLIRRQKKLLKSRSIKTGVKHERAEDGGDEDEVKHVSSRPRKNPRLSSRNAGSAIGVVDLTFDW